MQDDGPHGVRIEVAGPAGDLGVSEPVERADGLERVRRAIEDEAVRRGGSAQRPGAQLAVLDDLRMANDDLGAGGARPR